MNHFPLFVAYGAAHAVIAYAVGEAYVHAGLVMAAIVSSALGLVSLLIAERLETDR